MTLPSQQRSKENKFPEVPYIDGSFESNDVNQGKRAWPDPEKKPIRSGLYYVVPAQVMEDERIDCSEKILYALISGLAFNDGYCYASNKHFAEKMKCKEREIQNKLEKLQNCGYIIREVKKIGMCWDRKIYVCHSLISKNVYDTHHSAPSSCSTVHLQDAPQCTKVSEVILVSEVRSNSNVDKKLPTRESTAKGIEIASLLWQRIKHLNAKAKQPNLNHWGKEIDDMMRVDKRSEAEIIKMLDFIFTKDEFWYKNILSPNKLRKHFDAITLRMNPWKNNLTGSTNFNPVSSVKDSPEQVLAKQELNRKILAEY